MLLSTASTRNRRLETGDAAMEKVENFECLQVEMNGMTGKEIRKKTNSAHKCFVAFYKFELVNVQFQGNAI